MQLAKMDNKIHDSQGIWSNRGRSKSTQAYYPRQSDICK